MIALARSRCSSACAVGCRGLAIRRKPPPPRAAKVPRPPMNELITDSRVKLIWSPVGEEGEQPRTEVLSRSDALKLAASQGLDLVCVSAVQRPIVCRLMNYGQVQYKKMKEEKAKRAAQRNLTEKGMRIKALISDHDLDRKLDRAVAYMKKGHKVTFTLITRWDQLQVNEKALTDVYQRILRGLPMSNIIYKEGKAHQPRLRRIFTCSMKVLPQTAPALPKKGAAKDGKPGEDEEDSDSSSSSSSSSGGEDEDSDSSSSDEEEEADEKKKEEGQL